MSNINLIIEERAASIGNFMVGRLLPFRQKRAVGPFVFIDHMGPAILGEDQSMDVLPHPHIGLSTLTYLFEGSITHHDSIGTVQEIKPGEVNWMTAGKGIVHSERTPDYLRHERKPIHGLQIWVALPKALEQMEPSFSHTGSADLPTWQENRLHFKLIAGELFGKKSPVPVYSRLYFLEIKSTEKRMVDVSHQLFGEAGLYILEGSIHQDGNMYESKRILIANDAQLCHFEMEANTTIYLFGGAPFPEERFMYWNFVATSKALLEQAKENWKLQLFPKIQGETEFVPLPQPFKP